MARTDVQLMLDVKAGDEQSFELLLHKYRTPLVNFLFRMVRDTAVAEDLAQEFLLRSMRDGWWSRADPEVGSFRRFLLMLLKRFLAMQSDAGHRRFEVIGVTI